MPKLNPDKSHQVLLNSLSGKIARIYNNDKLSNNLKHDIACRLIAKTIGANSASILLYKGIDDNLFCAGRYIDPQFANAQPLGNDEGVDIVRIMKRIDVIEFFKINDFQIEVSDLSHDYFEKLYLDYCDFEFANPVKLPKKEFISFLKFYANNRERKRIDKNYQSYVKNIREDKHLIALNEPVTGAFYYALTHSEDLDKIRALLSSFSAKIHLDEDSIITTDLTDFPDRKLCSHNLSKKLGIQIDTNVPYIGVPLLVNNRPIGILRLLLRKNLEFFVPDLESESEALVVANYYLLTQDDTISYVKDILNIQSIAILLSLFIENLFFADGMRDISLKDALNRDISNLPVITDELTKVINCFGCVIRLSNINGKNVSIQGYSSAVSDYIKLLEKSGDPYITAFGTFHPVLIEMFYNKLRESNNTGKEAVIECLRVDFKSNYEPVFSYLYLDSNSRLVTSDKLQSILNSSQRKELTKIFSSVNTVFSRFDIKSIIQIPIKDQEFGVVTFANTSNRTFIDKDVEMLIPVINRLGLALKYDSSIAKAENASKEEIQNSQRVIYHQLLSPIVSMRNSYKNLSVLSKRNEFSTFDNRMKEITDTLENTIDFITFNQYLSNFFIDKKISPDFVNIQVHKFVINKARTYQMHAKYHRGIDIHVNEEYKHIPTLYSDTTLLSHIIQALIDNAIKYSYSHLKNDYSNENNPLYAPSGKPNKIYIDVDYVQGEHIITVENWGCKISDKERRNILEYMKRGDNAKNFEINGTGIGLFLVNILTKALNGILQIDSSDDHTKISLRFKQAV